jgi:hypothetical protein
MRNRAGLVVVLLLSVGASAWAAPVTFHGQSGSLAASVQFQSAAGQLTVTLTNTSTHDVLVPENILTGVFWDSDMALSLVKLSATLGDESEVLFDSPPAGGNVGGEWAYKKNLQGAAGGARYGISSSGLGLFGPSDRFPGPNLDGPNSVGGMEYGIVPAADNPATGNSAVSGANPFIRDSVVFVFSGLATTYDPSTLISNVWFQYGTSLSEPQFAGLPELVLPEVPDIPSGPGGPLVVPSPNAAASGLALFGLSVMVRRRSIR